jgi:hypothetical protein
VHSETLSTFSICYNNNNNNNNIIIIIISVKKIN